MAGRWFKLVSLAFCLAIFVALVYAGEKDFWSTKPYTQWSPKEVDKMLKNSPWAKEITLSAALTGMSGEEGGIGGGAGGEGEMGGGGGRTPRSGGGSNANAGQQGGSLSSFVVRWYARPVREALAQRFLLSPEPPKDTLDKLLKFNSPYYSILIERLPLGGGRGGRGRGGEAAQQLRQDTYLRKKNKQKIPLADVVMPTARGQALVLRFAKEQDGRPTLTVDDKEVELVIKVQDNTYHIKFKLADMVIKNQLEL